MWNDAGAVVRSLRGLLDVTMRALDDDLAGALQQVVDQLAAALDVRGVAINLHRPADDDFEIVAIHAPPEVVAALRGGTVPRATIERLIDPAFDVGGAYFVPAGSFDDELAGDSAVIPRDDRSEGPDGWHEDDELIVPIRSNDGRLIGFISIDEPVSGLRPGPDEVEVAVTIADAASAAVQTAQGVLEHRRDQQALAQLFDVSISLGDADELDTLLQRCCEGIRLALGFERVLIEVAEPGSADMQVRASAGWEQDGPATPISLDDLAALCEPCFEVEGCYLLSFDAAMARGGERSRRYSSTKNGSGPLAWDHHWLVVPLLDPSGRTIGFVWPDDPADRLLPTRGRLRILRTFANQAGAAIAAAGNLEQLRELARIDELTGALNRRAFHERLDAELVRTARTAETLTVVLCDLDQFKSINDRFGHPTGDAALRSFGAILERSVRSSDSVGRVGGDEFALLLVDIGEEETSRVLERIKQSLSADEHGALGLCVSFGASRAPDDGLTRKELVEVADRRLYLEKTAPS